MYIVKYCILLHAYTHIHKRTHACTWWLAHTQIHRQKLTRQWCMVTIVVKWHMLHFTKPKIKECNSFPSPLTLYLAFYNMPNDLKQINIDFTKNCIIFSLATVVMIFHSISHVTVTFFPACNKIIKVNKLTVLTCYKFLVDKKMLDVMRCCI